MIQETRRAQAEGIQFLRHYRNAFTTRVDGSIWAKYDRMWQNAARYSRGLLRPGSLNTVTDIADKMQVDQERLERLVRKSPSIKMPKPSFENAFPKRSKATTPH